MILICVCNSHNQNNPNGLFASVALIVLTVVLNALWQDYNRRRDIKERISNEIYAACEKLIQIAIQANYDNMQLAYYTNLYYRVTKETYPNKEDEFYKEAYIMKDTYMDEMFRYETNSREIIFEFNKATIDLTKHMHDLSNYVDKHKAIKITELIYKNYRPIVKDYKTIFNKCETLKELDELMFNEHNNSHDYVVNNSDGKHLEAIKDLIRSK